MVLLCKHKSFVKLTSETTAANHRARQELRNHILIFCSLSWQFPFPILNGGCLLWKLLAALTLLTPNAFPEKKKKSLLLNKRLNFPCYHRNIQNADSGAYKHNLPIVLEYPASTSKSHFALATFDFPGWNLSFAFGEPGKGRDRGSSWAPSGFAKAEPVPCRWKLIHGIFFFSWQPALSVLIKELCDQIEKVAGSCCVISSAEPLCSGTKLGSGLAFPCPWPGGNPEQNLGRKSGLVSRCSLNAWVRQKISFPSWPGEDGAASVSPFWSHLGNILSGQGWGAAGFAFTPEKWKCEKKKIFRSSRATRKMWIFPCIITTNRSLDLQDEERSGENSEPKRGRKRKCQVFGRVQALKMGGEAGVAFLGCHLESKPATSVLSPCQDLLAVTPWLQWQL